MLDSGKVYNGAGQSLFSMVELQGVLGDSIKPSLIALYDKITVEKYDMNPELQEVHNLFPGSILQVGLQFPLHDNSKMELLLKQSKTLIDVAESYKKLKQPVLLRVGYEFDGPWNGYDSKLYIRLYRELYRVFKDRGVDNVAFVWNSYSCNNEEIMKWYPGADVIDWHGFNTVSDTFKKDIYMSLTKDIKAPMMIGEASYAIVEHVKDFNEWVDKFKKIILESNIQAFQYINWQWDVYPKSMEWYSWKNGRITEDAHNLTIYKRFIESDFMVSRGVEYSDNVVLFVDCTRGLKDGEESLKNKDHSYMINGFSYHASNYMNAYGNGWRTSWKSRRSPIKISINKPLGWTGNIMLDIESNSSIRISIIDNKDEVIYKSITPSGNYVKLPYINAESTSFEIQIYSDTEISVFQLGLLSVTEYKDDGLELCNIYKNHRFHLVISKISRVDTKYSGKEYTFAKYSRFSGEYIIN